MSDRDELAKIVQDESDKHGLSDDGRGGYYCKCGQQWDWTEHRDAKAHRSLMITDAVASAWLRDRDARIAAEARERALSEERNWTKNITTTLGGDVR